MKSFSQGCAGSFRHPTACTSWLAAIQKSTIGEKTLIYCWILSCFFFLALQHATIAVPHVILLKLHPLTQGKMVTSPAQATLWISAGSWSGLKNMPLKIANRFIYKGEDLVMGLWQLMFLYIINLVNLKHTCKYQAKNNLLGLFIRY